MRGSLRLAAATALALLCAGEALAAVPSGFTERRIATGLSRPVALAAAPDGSIYIGEQYTGRILIWRNGALLPAPFATVSPVYGNSNETGLLGIALSPSYLADRHVYVFVTSTYSRQKVLRYTNQGDQGTGLTTIVGDLPSAGINHNGGGIAFGPDGALYVSVGDNGSSPSSANSTTDLRGKILRYNPDGSLPADNPWPGSPAYAIGIRNTFRIAFQPTTGKLFGSENGPNADDELNVIRRGAHHGWPSYTGVSGRSGYVDPIAVYTPTTSVTGIAFHDGGGQPALAGALLLAHYKAGTIRRITLGGSSGETVVSDADFVTGAYEVVDVAIGADGKVYYCTLTGDVSQVAGNSSSNVAPFASFTARPPSGAAPLVVDLDASGSTDVDGSVASYAWDLGSGQGAASGRAVVHTYPQAGNYTVTLTVTDNQGVRGTATRRIDVAPTGGNPPPSSHILSVTPITGKAPLNVSIEGHGHDDTDVVEHRWDYGDGNTEVVRNTTRDADSRVAHTYRQKGDYTVTLTVVDDQGATGVDTRRVTVTGCAFGGPGRSPADAAGALLPLAALLGALGLRRRRADLSA